MTNWTPNSSRSSNWTVGTPKTSNWSSISSIGSNWEAEIGGFGGNVLLQNGDAVLLESGGNLKLQ